MLVQKSNACLDEETIKDYSLDISIHLSLGEAIVIRHALARTMSRNPEVAIAMLLEDAISLQIKDLEK